MRPASRGVGRREAREERVFSDEVGIFDSQGSPPTERALRLLVAGAVLDRALREGENARPFDLFAGESAAFFAARGRSAGVISVLFAVDPLGQDIEQENTTQKAKREKNRTRHKE